MANAETKIQHDILEYLTLCNIVAWRNNAGMLRIGKRLIQMAPAGSPDIIGLMPDGRFLGIEVKMPREAPTPVQRKFLQRLKDNGALVFVARSIGDVEKELKGYGR